MSRSEFRMRGIESGPREARTAETVGENGRHGRGEETDPHTVAVSSKRDRVTGTLGELDELGIAQQGGNVGWGTTSTSFPR